MLPLNTDSAVPTVPAAFRASLPLLDERCTAILYARCVCTPPVLVRVLADHFGVSTPRIRQLEDHALRRCLGIWQATAPLLRQASAQLQALAANGYLAPEQALYGRLFGGHDRRLFSAHLAWLESRVIQRTPPGDPWEGTDLSARARHTLIRAGRDPAGLRHCDPAALQGIRGIGPLLAAEIYLALRA
jgi:hypothetical protein